MTSSPSSVLTVTQLNRQVRSWLEHEMGEVCVEGEISNLSKPSSGHFYFTLKDMNAQLRCVHFKNRHGQVAKDLQNGQQVLARGHLSLYEARGDYQLIVEELRDAGVGDLYKQFELLKHKLSALGLFDPASKKPIPRFPQCIGVITSPSGAALHDIQITLARRYPLADVIVYPSEVQGKQAPGQLILSLQRANAERRCDVIILARGGGSIEDLWAFNDEQLAYAIANSEIPIVSGVGHETDFTIADFVADLRAATPTAAAETVTPDSVALKALITTLSSRLQTAITRQIQHKQLLLQHLIQKISSPGQLIQSHWQTLDYMERQLQRTMQQSIIQKKHHVELLISRLQAKNPAVLIQHAKTNLQQLEGELTQLMTARVIQLKNQLTTLMATLHAVSPLATLERGYAIATRDHTILFDSQQVKPGDMCQVQLFKGSFTCEVIDLAVS